MSSQPTLLLSPWRRSAFPIAYHMHASQCAISANVAISSSKTAAPYSEYLSIFLATRTSRNNLAVFSRPISVVVWKIRKQKPIHGQRRQSVAATVHEEPGHDSYRGNRHGGRP